MIDVTDILQNEKPFRYMMLSRMKSDCDYYLGYGNRYAKYLWAGDEREQIDCMKALWNSFSAKDKPEWLTWDQILDYEQKMCPERLPPEPRVNPDLTLENSGWAGCRVTFWRASDDFRTSVDLYILPENYCGEREGFSLTVEERQMAYEELASRGIPVENYVIEKAEMFQFVREPDKAKEMPKIDDLIKSAESRKPVIGFPRNTQAHGARGETDSPTKTVEH